MDINVDESEVLAMKCPICNYQYGYNEENMPGFIRKNPCPQCETDLRIRLISFAKLMKILVGLITIIILLAILVGIHPIFRQRNVLNISSMLLGCALIIPVIFTRKYEAATNETFMKRTLVFLLAYLIILLVFINTNKIPEYAISLNQLVRPPAEVIFKSRDIEQLVFSTSGDRLGFIKNNHDGEKYLMVYDFQEREATEIARLQSQNVKWYSLYFDNEDVNIFVEHKHLNDEISVVGYNLENYQKLSDEEMALWEGYKKKESHFGSKNYSYDGKYLFIDEYYQYQYNLLTGEDFTVNEKEVIAKRINSFKWKPDSNGIVFTSYINILGLRKYHVLYYIDLDVSEVE